MAKETTSKPQKIYQITQTIFYIVVVPLLILAFISGMIMLNTKLSGGYPSFLGYTVIQFQDDSFYDVTNNRYGEGEYNLFFSLGENGYSVGDLIAYYSAPSDNPPIQGHLPDWPPTSLNATFEAPNSSTFEAEELSEVSFGIINNIDYIYDTFGNSYKCFSIFSSLDDQENGSDQDTIILAMDTIGVVAGSDPIFIGFLMYCSSFSSFITFVLLPCIILLGLQIISIFFKLSFEKEKRSGIKQKIRMEEIKNQDDFVATNNKLPKRPIGRVALAEMVESFDENKKSKKSNNVKGKIPARPFPVQFNNPPVRPIKPMSQKVVPQRPIPTKPIFQKPINPAPTKPIPQKPIPIKPIPQKPIKTIPQKPIPQRPVRPIPPKK